MYKNTIFTFIMISLCLLACQNSSDKVKEEPTLELEHAGQQLEVQLLHKVNAKLGEGALWNIESQTFYWVDIENKYLHIYHPDRKRLEPHRMPSRIGTVVSMNADTVLVALEDGVHFYDLKNRTFSPFCLIDKRKENIRFNDGKCDPMGRLWVGTMDMDCKHPNGALYMIDSNGQPTQKLDSITISNGIVWNKAKDKMYYIDTPTQQVAIFDYDVSNGGISNRKILCTIPDTLGSPDGMTIDEHDNLWIGLWNGNSVINVHHETGEIIKTIEVPAHNVTACAFGGPDLDILYITTASVDMTEEEMQTYPLAGSLFSVRPGVRGLPSPTFK